MNASEYLSHHLGEMIEVKEEGIMRGMAKADRDLLFFWRDALHSSSKNGGSGHKNCIREGK